MAPRPSSEPLTKRELDAWRGMLRTHSRAISALDRELVETHELTLSAYEVLLNLVDAPKGKMRMKEVADRLLLSRSGLTRLVDDLERRGFVRREPCVEDGRGLNAVLTPAGRAAFKKARRTHLRGVRERFLGKLSAGQQRALADAWSSVGLAGGPEEQ
jgi:DNA-binding MarR family transcriptional regulator